MRILSYCQEIVKYITAIARRLGLADAPPASMCRPLPQDFLD
jgi:hypothetical protein